LLVASPVEGEAEAVGRVEAIPELALELMEERALDLAELAEESTEETAEPALLPADEAEEATEETEEASDEPLADWVATEVPDTLTPTAAQDC
jgi:hypothetical protein